MRVAKSLQGMLVAGVTTCVAFALALPSTACLGSLAFRDGCFGTPTGCPRFIESACPHDVCTVTVQCHCKPPCNDDSVCAQHVNASACAGDSVCAWGNACTTREDGCWDLDQGRCG